MGKNEEWKSIKKNKVYHRGENRNSRIHQGKINSRGTVIATWMIWGAGMKY